MARAVMVRMASPQEISWSSKPGKAKGRVRKKKHLTHFTTTENSSLLLYLRTGVAQTARQVRKSQYFVEVAFWSLRETLRKFHRKAVESGLPVPNGHSPFLGDIAHRQVDHLVHRLIRGENTVVVSDLAQSHIERLNRVGRVDHAADIGRKRKKREHPRPPRSPGL